MDFNLTNHLNITNMVANGKLLGTYCNFQPTITDAVLDCFCRTFVKNSRYVEPFWTIHYELWGYIFCMLTCHFTRKSRLRRLGYLVISLLLALTDVTYISFFIGLFAADLICFPEQDTSILSGIYRFIYHRPVQLILWIIGLYFASCPMYYAGIHACLAGVSFLNPELVRALGCGIIVFCLCSSRLIQSILEWKPFLLLGSISFPMYALHWPFMLSLQAILFERFSESAGYHTAAVSSFLITAAVIIIVSFLVLPFERLKIWTIPEKVLEKTTLP